MRVMLRVTLAIAAVLAVCGPAAASASIAPTYPDTERTQDSRLVALVSAGEDYAATIGWPAHGKTAEQYCPSGIDLYLATIPPDRAAEAVPCQVTFSRDWLASVRATPDPTWECAVAAHEAVHALGMMWHTAAGLMTGGIIDRADYPLYCRAPPAATIAAAPRRVVRKVTLCEEFDHIAGTRCYSP